MKLKSNTHGAFDSDELLRIDRDFSNAFNHLYSSENSLFAGLPIPNNLEKELQLLAKEFEITETEQQLRTPEWETMGGDWDSGKFYTFRFKTAVIAGEFVTFNGHILEFTQ